MSPTNVKVAFLSQNMYFMYWWARVAHVKPIGIAQRFMLSFGGDSDPASVAMADFNDKVARPILKRLFVCMMKVIGPKLMSDTSPTFQCSPEQNLVADEFMELNTMFKRRSTTPLVMQEVLPMAN